MHRSTFVQSILLACLVIIGGLMTYFYFSGSFTSAFSLLSVNFDKVENSIPYNVKELTFGFSHDIDSKNMPSVVIEPFVAGTLSVEGNTLRYILQDTLILGSIYTIHLENVASKQYTKTDESIYQFTLEAVAAPVVQFISPQNSLSNYKQSIVAIFSMPMIAMQSVQSLQSKDCPIRISPSITGTCQRLSSSVVRFVPDTVFMGATTYTIDVVSSDDFLYPLEEEKTVSFNTEALKFFVDEQQAPNQGIHIASNVDIALRDIQPHLRLFSLIEKNNQTVKQELPIQIVKSKQGGGFVVDVSKPQYLQYGQKYQIEVASGRTASSTNIPFAGQTFAIQMMNFISDVTIVKKVRSSTGVIIDERYIYDTIIPVDDFSFVTTLANPLEVIQDNFVSLIDSNNTKIPVSVNFGYDMVYNDVLDVYEQKLSDTKIIITPQQGLQEDTPYILSFANTGNPYVPENMDLSFRSAKMGKILRYIQHSPTIGCLYTNVALPERQYIQSGAIDISPKANIKYMYQMATDLYDYYGNPLDIGGCPKEYARDNNAFLYMIDMRLNPESQYTLSFTDSFVDVYGMGFIPAIIDSNVSTSPGLAKNTFLVTTGGPNKEDIYIYTTHKNKNIIPTDLPVTMQLQTINLDKLTVDVCTMDYASFIKNNDQIDNYSDRIDFQYLDTCISIKKVEVSIKNRWWEISPTFISIEEILGREFGNNESVVLVRLSTPLIETRQYVDTVYIRSDQSLYLERSGDKDLLYYTDFQGNPVLSAKFTFMDRYANVVQVPYRFNKDTGVYEIISTNQSYGYDYIVAVGGSKTSFLDTRYDELSNYDFGYVMGNATSTKNYAYIYTDRPIYKPGDIIQYKGILRDFGYAGYAKTALKNIVLSIKNLDSYEDIWSQKMAVDSFGHISGSFSIPDDIGLGAYRFTITDERGEYYIVDNFHVVYIEEYIPAPFKVDIKKSNEDLFIGESISFDISATYYFGAKIINADGSYTVQYQNYFFDAGVYNDYIFGDGNQYWSCIYRGMCSFQDGSYTRDDALFRLDESGNGTVFVSYPEDSQQQGERIYTYSFTVTDPTTKNTVTSSSSVVVHTTDGYVGVRAPYRQTKEDGIDIQGITLQNNGDILKNAKINLSVDRLERNNIRKQGLDGFFYNEYEDTVTQVLNQSLSSNNDGLFTLNFKPTIGGRFRITATYVGSNGKSFSSSSEVYVMTDDYVVWNTDNNDVTNIIADTQRAKVGDTVGYTVQTPFDTGTMLVMIQKDDGILDYFVKEVTTMSERINIPVKQTYYPNFYVKVYYIGKPPSAQLPVYKRALTTTRVDVEDKNLYITIQADKPLYAPDDSIQLDVQIKDIDGKPVSNAHGSVSIVDQSVLALKGNPQKNPFAFFYDMKRYLGTQSFGSIKYILEKLEIIDASDGSKGGDGNTNKGGDSKKKRGNFKDTAWWLADFVTDSNGNARLVSPGLPDNLTTWNVEILATTPNDNKIGITSIDLISSNEVVIQDNLPSFLLAGDTIAIAPNVVNRGDGSNDTFIITISGDNLLFNNTNTTISLSQNDTQAVPFEVVVPKMFSGDMRSAKARIHITATNQRNGAYDSIEKIIPIVPSSFPQTITSSNSFTKTTTEKYTFNDRGDLPVMISVDVSRTPITSLMGPIELLSYDQYGCLEQRISPLLPYMYLQQLYKQFNTPFDLSTKKMPEYFDQNKGEYVSITVSDSIQTVVKNLSKFQNLDGGFRYWESFASNSSLELSLYIANTLVRFRDGDIDIDQAIRDKLSGYLRGVLQNNKNHRDCYTGICPLSIEEKITILHTIAMLDSFEISDFDLFMSMYTGTLDTAQTLYSIQTALLLQKNVQTQSSRDTLSAIISSALEKIVTNELVVDGTSAYIGSVSYGQRSLLTALYLEILVASDMYKQSTYRQIIDKIGYWLQGQQKNGSRGSTVQTVSIIRALIAWSQTMDIDANQSNQSTIRLNNVDIASFDFGSGDVFANFNHTRFLSPQQYAGEIVIGNRNLSPLYYTLSYTYWLEPKDQVATNNGLYVDQYFYDYNEYLQIYTKQQAEQQKLFDGDITIEELIYPARVFTYLTPRTGGVIGDILISDITVYASTAQEHIALDSYIPAGSRLINPTLATSEKLQIFVDRNVPNVEEFRYQKYFAYMRFMDPGIHTFQYAIRLTHSGLFGLRPTHVFDFYQPNVFGQTQGTTFSVK